MIVYLKELVKKLSYPTKKVQNFHCISYCGQGLTDMHYICTYRYTYMKYNVLYGGVKQTVIEKKTYLPIVISPFRFKFSIAWTSLQSSRVVSGVAPCLAKNIKKE